MQGRNTTQNYFFFNGRKPGNRLNRTDIHQVTKYKPEMAGETG